MASATAITFIHAALVNYIAGALAAHQDAALTPQAMTDAVAQILSAANQAVLEAVDQRPECQGMATTVVCGVIVQDTLVVGWAGDSRAYVHTDTGLTRVTQDHSEVRELVERGILTEEEAQTHPSAHTITRYLGQEQHFQPQVGLYPLHPGAVVLLCTDGLTDVVPDTTIEDLLSAYRRGQIRLEQLPQRLVTQALAQGTHDNTTVLCCCHFEPHVIDGGLATNRTLTGDYTIVVAKALRRLNKENRHERTPKRNPRAAQPQSLRAAR